MHSFKRFLVTKKKLLSRFHIYSVDSKNENCGIGFSPTGLPFLQVTN